jgi:glutamine synthetase
LGDALTALENDDVMRQILPEGMIENYAVMKRKELEVLGKMEDWQRRIWLIERY